jgi:hypothetical protein
MKKKYIKCHQWGYQQEGLHLTITMGFITQLRIEAAKKAGD